MTPAPSLHVLKGPRVPETPGHPFLCEHFRGTLTGSECLRRQTTRVKAPAQAADRSARVPQHLEYCASGKCEQGAEIAKKFPGWKPEDRPKPDWAVQMEAKRQAEAAAPPMRGLAVRPAPVEPVEQLKRECADVVLSMKKPNWLEWKAEKDKKRDVEPAPEPMERPPHPLSNRGLEEETMAEVTEAFRTCSEEGCSRALRSDNKTGLCKDHANKVHQRKYQAKRNGKPPKPRAAPPQQLHGQDEFDLMIAIRDQFRRLSAPARAYVLSALKAVG